jgi:Mlc titration factor MtfA (ptsG expression regulator)
MRGLAADEDERLRALAEHFLAGKHFSGTHGLAIEERMRVVVAAQACILVLELGIEWYEGWSEIIVYPSQFAPEREVMDEAGVVHLTNDPMAGEAWLGGPVVLSYEDVALAGDEEQRVAGYNVVIHEFAHKLDMRNGDPNGFPPLHRGMPVAAWKAAFAPAYEDFCARVDAADRLAPRRAQAALDALPLDPYAGREPGRVLRRGLGGVLRDARVAGARVPRGVRAAQALLPPGPPEAPGVRPWFTRLALDPVFHLPSAGRSTESGPPSPRDLLRAKRSASSISFSSAAVRGAASRASRSMSWFSTCSFKPSLYWRVPE